MVGYACDETLDFMPLEYTFARRLTNKLEHAYASGEINGIGLDGKSQVSAEFDEDRFIRFTKIAISIQHKPDKDMEELRSEITEKVIYPVFADFDLEDTEILINPSGRFVTGGIEADTGLTGRKIVADSYGPRVPVGGGAFSGKDPRGDTIIVKEKGKCYSFGVVLIILFGMATLGLVFSYKR